MIGVICYECTVDDKIVCFLSGRKIDKVTTWGKLDRFACPLLDELIILNSLPLNFYISPSPSNSTGPDPQ